MKAHNSTVSFRCCTFGVSIVHINTTQRLTSNTLTNAIQILLKFNVILNALGHPTSLKLRNVKQVSQKSSADSATKETFALSSNGTFRPFFFVVNAPDIGSQLGLQTKRIYALVRWQEIFYSVTSGLVSVLLTSKKMN